MYICFRFEHYSKTDEQTRHRAMYTAAKSGAEDASTANLLEHQAYINDTLGITLETALHVAVATGRSVVAENLVNRLIAPSTINNLGIKDHLGLTPLHVAALTGNFKAAQVLVDKLNDLLYVKDKNDLFPVHLAAKSGHRGTLYYLIRCNIALDGRLNPLTGEDGLRLLNFMIDSDFLG